MPGYIGFCGGQGNSLNWRNMATMFQGLSLEEEKVTEKQKTDLSWKRKK